LGLSAREPGVCLHGRCRTHKQGKDGRPKGRSMTGVGRVRYEEYDDGSGRGGAMGVYSTATVVREASRRGCVGVTFHTDCNRIRSRSIRQMCRRHQLATSSSPLLAVAVTPGAAKSTHVSQAQQRLCNGTDAADMIVSREIPHSAARTGFRCRVSHCRDNVCHITQTLSGRSIE
jgi:hypothetical protein